MPDEVTLEVTTIEENVTVETTAGDVVEIQVLAPTGATGPAGPNSVTSATTSNGTANLTLNNVSTVSFTAGNSSTTSGEITIFTNGPVFQWRSDTVEYGERGFTFLTTDITSEVNYTLPNATGTIALTTSNVATATALQNSRNIFGITFNGTANVAGDATNTGHFASIPTGGQAGHFVTLNGTAPTVVAGRSAWWSDGSGNPSFRNGTGTAVTLVKSSDLGTNVATFLATPTSANLASALTDENGTGGGFVRAEGATLTSPALVGPVNLTSQDASTADRVMTRALGDARHGVIASVVLPSTQIVTNSTTLTGVTGGSVTLAEGTWHIRCCLMVDAVNTTPGIKADINISGLGVNVTGKTYISGFSSIVTLTTQNPVIGVVSNLCSLNEAGVTYRNIEFSGIIVLPTSRTLQMRLAQRTSSADAVSIWGGSHFVATRIA